MPGDTKDKHIATVCDMLDAGIEDLRLFQFILLPGTEANDVASRARHRYRTGFRVLARGFGRYAVYGQPVAAAEIQEVCLGTDTMPADDYVACRAFDLTISIFNNAGILREFFRAAEALGVKRSIVLRRIFQNVHTTPGPIADVYQEFHRAEARNFFDRRDALEQFLAAAWHPRRLPARRVWREPHLPGPYRGAGAALSRGGGAGPPGGGGGACRTWPRGRPAALLLRRAGADVSGAQVRPDGQSTGESSCRATSTFLRSTASVTGVDPRRAHVPEGIRLRVAHTDSQRADLPKYFAQYRDQPGRAGTVLQRNDSHLNSSLYRHVGYVDAVVPLDLPGHFEPPIRRPPSRPPYLDRPLLDTDLRSPAGS